MSLGVQKLEKTLGVKLLRRGGRDFSLTDEGRELLQFCKRFEAGLQTVVENFDPKEGSRAVSSGTSNRDRAFGRFRAARFGLQPGREVQTPVELELTAQNTYDLMRSLTESQIDAALLPNDVHDSHLRFRPDSPGFHHFHRGPENAALVSKPDWMEHVEHLNLITYPRDADARVDRQDRPREATAIPADAVDQQRRGHEDDGGPQCGRRLCSS